MNLPAALLLQSVPFAGLLTATLGRAADLFVVLYVVAFGLLMSLIALSDDHGALMKTIVATGLID